MKFFRSIRTRDISADTLRDSRMLVAVSIVLVSSALAELSLYLSIGLYILGMSVWFRRPLTEKPYKAYKHYVWGRPFTWHHLPNKTAVRCPGCGRLIAQPQHLKVTECRCGVAVMTAGSEGHICQSGWHWSEVDSQLLRAYRDRQLAEDTKWQRG